MKVTISAILFTLTTLALAKEGTYLEKVPPTGGVRPIRTRTRTSAAESGLLARRPIAKDHCAHEFGWCKGNGLCCLPQEWCCSFGCCSEAYPYCGSDKMCYRKPVKFSTGLAQSLKAVEKGMGKGS